MSLIVYFISLLLQLLLFCHEGDATITWTAPPPQRGPLQTSDATIRRTTQRLLNGSSEERLSWNFILSGETLDRVTWQLGNNRIGKKTSSGTITIDPTSNFQEHFGISASDQATLIIYNVTEADEAVFSCKVETDRKVWADEIQVKIVVPPDITVISDNQTVNETDNVTLHCAADGLPQPTITWTRISDNSNVTFPLTISRQDQGGYRCTADNGVGSPVTKVVFIIVQYKPDAVTLVTNTTENKDCSDSLWVKFTCNATQANPAVYNYQLYGGEEEVSNSASGTWIKNLSDGGKHDYSCLAQHLVGNVTSANNVTLIVNVPVSLKVNNNEIVKQEGQSVSVYCNVSGFPDPTVTWTRVGGVDAPIEGKWLNITNITRGQAGHYTCEANNTCGTLSTNTSIDVQYKPDNVTLVTNTTENKDCSDSLWVKFTCNATQANPAVYNYQLYGSEEEVSNSASGTWMKKVSDGGKHDYSCLAQHLLGNVTSANNVTLTVNVPVSLKAINTDPVNEGGNVSLYCNASGYPVPTVYWSKVDAEVRIEGNWLNITTINKSQAGDYKCHANNTCGTVSTNTAIDVQYKPENVSLTTSNKVCNGSTVKFTCTADANPAVSSYSLHKNNVNEMNTTTTGVWIITMDTPGQFTYKCEANNSKGTGRSSDITLTVDVPASVTSVNSTIPNEGDSVTLFCDVSGDPSPNVSWIDAEHEVVQTGATWELPSISRNYTGEYKCIANNTCGTDNKTAVIDVQYKPDMVTLETNKTDNKTCFDSLWVKFTCNSTHANPPVYNYQLYGGEEEVSNSINGTWIKNLSDGGKHDYSCLAQHTLGNVTSANNVTLIVNVPVSFEAIISEPVKEGDSVSLHCSASGVPDPTVTWTKVGGVDVPIEGKWLNITNITRGQAGHYRCEANNTCGTLSTNTSIDVQYKPDMVTLETNKTDNKTCFDSLWVKFTCNSTEANPAVSNYQLYGGEEEVSNSTSGTWIKNLSDGGKHDYSCLAQHSLGNVTSANNVTLTVNVPASVTSVNSTNPNEGDNVTLVCNVFGDPSPNVSWIDAKYEVIQTGATWELPSISRNYTGDYKCIANNTCGTDNKTAVIDVQYPPSVIDHSQTIRVSEGNPVSLICPVDGNPEPSIKWYMYIENDSSGGVRHRGKKWTLPQSNSGWYSCSANNSLGTISARLQLIVEERKTTTSQTTPTKTSQLVKGTFTITNRDCNDSAEVEKDLPEVINKTVKHLGIVEDVKIDTGCGSVIVDFVLRFSQSVSAGDVISALKTAAQQGQFGKFIVDPDSIKQTLDTKSTEAPVCTSFFKLKNCESNVWVIVGLAVAGVVVIAVVIGIVAWWVHKRRKCRRDTRTHHCGDAQRLQGDQNGGGENDYSLVNGGYAHSGPLSANGVAAPAEQQEQQGATASPNVAEQNIHQYAVVNKKKKKEVDDTYAQVDMSKKSKKKPKPKPGEVLYADLGDFQQPKQMPSVSTSPAPLPPIKRPAAYEETQYADITQYLKGDAALPASNNSQATQMESAYANVEGDGGKEKETKM